MFDENLIKITGTGRIVYENNLNENYKSFIRETTTKDAIPSSLFADNFAHYLELRSKILAA